MSDFSEQAEAKRIEIYRAMSGERKLQIAYELYLFAHEVVESSIREYFPGINPEELRTKMVERFHG